MEEGAKREDLELISKYRSHFQALFDHMNQCQQITDAQGKIK